MNLEIVLVDFIITLYAIFVKFKSGTYNSTLFLCALILYVILKLLYYVNNKGINKKILILITLIYVLILGFKNSIFFLFLPSTLFLILEFYNHKFIITLSLILFIYIEYTELREDFLLIFFISMILNSFYFKRKENIERLILDKEDLRQRNHNLNEKLRKKEEYIDHMEYLNILNERNKISQSIHDNIGHTLAGSIMQLEAQRVLLNIEEIEKAKGINEKVIEVLKEGMEKIRETLKLVKPKREEIGINNLKLIIKEAELKNKVNISLSSYGDLEKINYIQWSNIIPTVKESITNSIKYSKCSRINIEISVLNKIIRLNIKDNGIGSKEIKKGMGLLGIEERAVDLKGQALFYGDQGFSVVMLIPIEQ